MPSINGIEIRDFKQWETRRGIAYEAALYYEGEKIGGFENKGIGGATSIFISPEFRELFHNKVNEYYKENPARNEDEDQFVEELMEISDDLFMYETNAKDKIMLTIMPHARTVAIEEISMDNLIPNYIVVDTEEQLAETLEELMPKYYRIYRSLDDFNI